MRVKYWIYKQKISLSLRLRKMMKCICSGEQLRIEDIIPSSESLATRDYSASGYSSRAGDDAKADTSNIEEAESSLRESGILNYEVGAAKDTNDEVSFSFDPIVNCSYLFHNQMLLSQFSPLNLILMQ